ncbi:hypothetical protein, conserved [Leishmania shawi]|uniref:Uncharacterized protein n=1 Tax=Leishmania shawi TaxID=5680 RepID=A0ABR3DZ25_9TRYP
MNSLLRTFQTVVALGEEDSRGGVAPSQRSNLHDQSDPAVLRQHISTLTQELFLHEQSYKELREESTSIEKELTHLRLRFAAARKLWKCTNENLELAIQHLVEHQLFGGVSTVPSIPSTALGSSSSKASRCPPGDSVLDATYVASLREQVERLKEMVMQNGEERSRLQSAKQYEEAQLVLHANGVSVSCLDAEVRVALRKLVAQWSEERASYESFIESLENSAARHAEREALLSDCIKQEQERRAEAAARCSALESGELRRLREELAEWQRGGRVPIESVSVDPNRASRSVEPVSASVTQHPDAEDVNDTSYLPYNGADAHFLVSLEDTGVPSDTGATTQAGAALRLDAGDNAVAEKLERLNHDCSARDEALDNLYRDNRNLHEAVQRAESRVRVCEAELQHCQRQMEELALQLSREQHRTKCLMDENRRAAVSEGKLREQVMQLRQALNTASASQASLSAQNELSARVCVPQVIPVRVRQPFNVFALEQRVTYEKNHTWENWVQEAARWWKEWKENDVGLRSPEGHNVTRTAHARGGRVLPRGSRRLLTFGSILIILMVMYVFIMFTNSVRTTKRSRDAA